MGTNYYRIASAEEVEAKRYKLLRTMIDIELKPDFIERGCRIDVPDSLFDTYTPWDEFMEGMSVHLGKRSGGWKFCWNFNKNKYYKNKEELLDFIRKGRIIDEYGEEEKPEEFIEMALSWGEPDGYIYNQKYLDDHPDQRSSWMSNEVEYFDLEIDGLRVSRSNEFS